LGDSLLLPTIVKALVQMILNDGDIVKYEKVLKMIIDISVTNEHS
jgi:hypothetical protein